MSREQCLSPQAGGVTGRDCRGEPTSAHPDNDGMTEAV